MVIEGINTAELIQNAKADASSFIVIAISIVVSFFIAWIISRSFDKYLQNHLSDALWLQENRKKVKIVLMLGGTVVLTLVILSITNVFSELSWLLAPIAIISVYLGKKSLQNITEYFALVVEGKIQPAGFIRVDNPLVKIHALGRITERDSRKSFFKTVDGGEIIIRSHDIFEATIENFAHSTLRRITIELEFPIHHKVKDIDECIIHTIKTFDNVLTQYPIDPLLDSLHDGQYHYLVHFWVSKDDINILKMRQDMKKAIYAMICEKNFALPYLHKDTVYSLS